MGRSKREDVGSATSAPTCASCGCELGKEAGKIPFFVDDHAAIPGEKAKHEAFCPTCFVYVRSPREPHRFPPGVFLAVKCTKCGLRSVSIGAAHCMQCQNRRVVILLPTPGVV